MEAKFANHEAHQAALTPGVGHSMNCNSLSIGMKGEVKLCLVLAFEYHWWLDVWLGLGWLFHPCISQLIVQMVVQDGTPLPAMCGESAQRVENGILVLLAPGGGFAPAYLVKMVVMTTLFALLGICWALLSLYPCWPTVCGSIIPDPGCLLPAVRCMTLLD